LVNEDGGLTVPLPGKSSVPRTQPDTSRRREIMSLVAKVSASHNGSSQMAMTFPNSTILVWSGCETVDNDSFQPQGAVKVSLG
jgi:hypothetical protein